MAWTHVVAALAAGLASAFFMRLGVSLYHRPPGLDPRGTVRAFGIWWIGVAASTAANGAMVVLAAWGWTTAALVSQSIGIIATAVGLWGLLSYVLFVYRGRDARRWVAAFYAPLAAATTFVMWTGARPDIVLRTWSVETVGSGPGGDLLGLLFMLAFLLPAVVGSLLMLGLAPQASGPQRRRILAAGIGIPAWVLLHVLARLAHTDALALASRVVLGVLVAAVIALAYGAGPQMARLPGRFDERVAELV